MEIILNPKYHRLYDYIEHIEEHFPQGEAVQESFNEIRKLRIGDLTLNVKRYGSSISRRLKFYKMAKGKRAFTFQRLLRERGYESPEPVAFVRYRKHMLTSSTYFVTIQTSLRYTLDSLSQFSESEQEEILKAFAAFTKRFHEDGFIHQNYKTKHILFDKQDNGTWTFALIDVNRVQRHRHKINVERGLKGFERLVLPLPQIKLLAREYAQLRAYDTDKAEDIVLRNHAAYQEKVRRRGR